MANGPNNISLVKKETRWDYADPEFRHGIAVTFSIDQSLRSIFGDSKVAAEGDHKKPDDNLRGDRQSLVIATSCTRESVTYPNWVKNLLDEAFCTNYCG